MICKKTCGKGGRGLAEYLLRNGRGQIIAGTMAGNTPRELAAELGQLRRLNPRLGKAIAHFSLNPSPDDPPLSEEKFEAIAARFMNEMGFGDAPWVGVIHRDTHFEGRPRPHLHILALRLDRSGRTVSDANDFRKAEASMRGIERDFGLLSVPDPPRKKPKPIPTTTTRGEQTMNDITPSTSNPFQPDDPRHAVWPDGFEPGRDLAELGMIENIEGIVATSASVGEELSVRRSRDMRRLTVEKDYEAHLKQLFGDELRAVFKHAGGAVLYFQPGDSRIADSGSTLTALGGDMPEAQAAIRIVAIAKARAWPSITFTGSPKFVELAMREAMAHGMKIVAKGDEQAAILAKLIAEKQGGMGAMAGPSIEDDPILAPLAELYDLPAQTSPRTAPTPAPVAPPPASPKPEPQLQRDPVLGVFPAFPNLRERIKERRDRLAHSQPRPIEPVPPQPFKRRQP
jgi:hypothetical protein